MTIFEFVLTGFTLVLALAVTRLLGGLRYAMDRRRGYWVHCLLVIAMLFLTSLIWWGLWYSRKSDWTYVAFAYNLLIGPGMLYFTTTLLIPDNPRRVRSWREHYFRYHKLFYGAFALLTIMLFAGSLLFTETPLLHFTRILQAASLALCIIGIRSDHHVVHATLAVLICGIIGVAAVYSELTSQQALLNGALTD
ncbi:MAG: hypothetical protein AAGG11_08155 [Pseudomonadota bacterium]